jgi:hypothetical protein
LVVQRVRELDREERIPARDLVQPAQDRPRKCRTGASQQDLMQLAETQRPDVEALDRQVTRGPRQAEGQPVAGRHALREEAGHRLGGEPAQRER